MQCSNSSSKTSSLFDQAVLNPRSGEQRNVMPSSALCSVTPDSPDLPNDQKIVQHPHRSELLPNGRLGSREILNPGRHMERSHGRALQAERRTSQKTASKPARKPARVFRFRIVAVKKSIWVSVTLGPQKQSAPGSRPWKKCG